MNRAAPLLLLILDGWGLAPAGPGNAISLARTPNVDRLRREFPHTRLRCSGRAVGLPDGFMGNSEVGHMNIGAGRVIYQDMTRIDMAVEDGSLASNPALADLAAKVKARGGRLHFMGLVSDGGVHSHIRHLKALALAAKALGAPVLVHAFLDGRDTPPQSGRGFIADLDAFLHDNDCGTIASITGRFYAMDRDKRWDRVGRAYAALTSGTGAPLLSADAAAAVDAAYAAGETDEFVTPRLLAVPGGEGGPIPDGCIRDGDGVFFFNFRADRAREITQAFIRPDFDGFPREATPDLAGFVSMTEYESTFGIPVAFAPESYTGVLGQAVSEAGLVQLRLAETEKYAHVTYFFNCGREEPFPGENRLLVPSPREVATYDQKPQMSAREVTETFLREWEKGYGLYVVNLANPDMVGHTGDLAAAIMACEVVDECVGRMVQAVLASGGRLCLTADHGNAEEMIDAHGGKMTAHTLNEVPFVLADPAHRTASLSPGVLGDIAPTLLKLLGLEKPREMTGKSLLGHP
ncbi:2,3-bisphosphoglycerate-independent phosphoglycerate mutase [Desulfovibrio sulfodismutans]|uniref:2,3-bisphosphoglycerate-independent phosphoglycerate mutase n=1 Tax=Desulfolutivibrio sulfodismutans TaxID=63561 RepID=A0A7K3NJD1_9BACT|nr:2,3-bisphosphoglycerate-independent phosphoglycerate mutase [Desulfolutivibrio sulfodismutans]NDY55329.1 2,3-bisphosphoglycerate-independent phosphoglycerate mutase [Desulfolutivibrio sulfodismutans]QLA11031.1 2,3-bisphosphoglycerate-independent phosphoglycerate mutase [Desulfolutivibrio sulfodismutans DSM 3696]